MEILVGGGCPRGNSKATYCDSKQLIIVPKWKVSQEAPHFENCT